MRTKTIIPKKCDGCLFQEHSSNGGIPLFGCKYYSNENFYPSIQEGKLPFCRVERIEIYEREE